MTANSFHLQRDAEGILTVSFDQPQRSVNTLSSAALEELDGLLGAVERGEHKAAGVIFTSAKPGSFIAGADLNELSSVEGPARDALLELGQRVFDRLAALPVPTVAAINGHALGGGLELALACRYRVAVDDGSINIGLPEIKLGLVPAWGGTTRMTRQIGLLQTLEAMLAGKTLPPRKARKLGIVDEVVRPEALLDAARRLIRTQPPVHRPPRASRLLLHQPPLLDMALRRAARATRARTFGNYPAPERLIEVVRAAARRGHQAGLEAERQALLELSETEGTRNLIRLFFLRQQAKRQVQQLRAQPAAVHQAAVVGGGAMGAGITHALITSGIPVRLVEVNPPAASAALQRIAGLLEDDVRAGRLSRLQARHALHRVSPTTDWTGLALADLVIEAVAEKLSVKRQVFTDLDRLTRPQAVLASNTSSLDLDDLALATARPQRVVGMHFFNPVPRMPLVEVVRGEQSEPAALATAAALAQRMGKVPILVNNGPGFLVNRLLFPYLAEAIQAASEGLSIEQIDRAMKQWGMPMGPFELLDQVGLDIVSDIFRAVGPRLGDHLVVPPTFERVVAAGWLGRKGRGGFYVQPARRWWGGRGPARPNQALLGILTRDGVHPPQTALNPEAIQWRLVLPMVNEAARMLREGIVDSTDTIDLATVLGLGLAPFRGGLIQFAQSEGLATVVSKLDGLARVHGPRFTPVPELRALAASGRPMQDLAPAAPAAPVPASIPRPQHA